MRLLSVVLLHAVRGPDGGDYLSDLKVDQQVTDPRKAPVLSLETHELGVLVAGRAATLLVPWANIKACLVAPEPEPQAAVEPPPKRGPGRPPKTSIRADVLPIKLSPIHAERVL
jgi:hypothetical protein